MHPLWVLLGYQRARHLPNALSVFFKFGVLSAQNFTEIDRYGPLKVIPRFPQNYSNRHSGYLIIAILYKLALPWALTTDVLAAFPKCLSEARIYYK